MIVEALKFCEITQNLLVYITLNLRRKAITSDKFKKPNRLFRGEALQSSGGTLKTIKMKTYSNRMCFMLWRVPLSSFLMERSNHVHLNLHFLLWL